MRTYITSQNNNLIDRFLISLNEHQVQNISYNNKFDRSTFDALPLKIKSKVAFSGAMSDLWRGGESASGDIVPFSKSRNIANFFAKFEHVPVINGSVIKSYSGSIDFEKVYHLFEDRIEQLGISLSDEEDEVLLFDVEADEVAPLPNMEELHRTIRNMRDLTTKRAIDFYKAVDPYVKDFLLPSVKGAMTESIAVSKHTDVSSIWDTLVINVIKLESKVWGDSDLEELASIRQDVSKACEEMVLKIEEVENSRFV